MKQVVVVVDKMVVVVVVVDKMVRYEQHWIMYVYPDLNILAGQVGPGPMIAAAGYALHQMVPSLHSLPGESANFSPNKTSQRVLHCASC